MKLSQNERYIFVGVCLLISALAVMDMIEDLTQGSPISHVLVEASILILIALLISISLKRSAKKQTSLKRNLAIAINESKEWKEKVEGISEGLSAIIDQQFQAWQLTKAESEVAWLIVKGLSHKEISEIRSTAEKTIRQQSATIYKKAGVNGRAELAAIFIEDLLMPLENGAGK